MEYENEIKGILVTFYRNGRDGDYMDSLTKAIYEIGRISEKNFCKPVVSGNEVALPSVVEMLAEFTEHMTKTKMDDEETLRLRKELVKDEAKRWLEKRGKTANEMRVEEVFFADFNR